MGICALLSSLGCQQPASPLLPPLCSHCQSSSWPPPAQARNWYQDQEVSVLIWTADHATPIPFSRGLPVPPALALASPGEAGGGRGGESHQISVTPLAVFCLPGTRHCQLRARWTQITEELRSPAGKLRLVKLSEQDPNMREHKLLQPGPGRGSRLAASALIFPFVFSSLFPNACTSLRKGKSFTAF